MEERRYGDLIHQPAKRGLQEAPKLAPQERRNNESLLYQLYWEVGWKMVEGINKDHSKDHKNVCSGCDLDQRLDHAGPTRLGS